MFNYICRFKNKKQFNNLFKSINLAETAALKVEKIIK